MTIEADEFHAAQIEAMYRNEVNSLLNDDMPSVIEEMERRDLLDNLHSDLGFMTANDDYSMNVYEIRSNIRYVAEQLAIERLDNKGHLSDGDVEWLKGL